MFKSINQPYPLELSFQKNFRISLFTGFFIAFFLFVFQPVHVIFNQSEMSLSITVIYGIISFVTMFSFFYLIPKYFLKVFNEELWTVKKELFYQFLLVFFIALFNYLFTLIYFGIGFNTFIPVFASTFLLAVFPISAIVFYKQNLNLKKYLKETDLINASLNQSSFKKDIYIDGVGKNENISFELEDLLFIKSQGNYCDFYFTDNRKNEVIRNSLLDVQTQISSNKIYKCHRSYLVNLDNIKNVSGNAQGLRLHFNGQEESVPVSRNLSKELRALLLKNS